ncbi:hypothetical protein CR513_12484, partial [Mucuna pruriens]
MRMIRKFVQGTFGVVTLNHIAMAFPYVESGHPGPFCSSCQAGSAGNDDLGQADQENEEEIRANLYLLPKVREVVHVKEYAAKARTSQ